MRGHKTVGLSGSFSGTAHYNTSVLRKLLVDYKNTGIDTYFEIQITNEHPASAAGRQTVFYLVVLLMAVHLQNLMRMVNIWMKKVKGLLRISRCLRNLDY